MNRNKIYFSLLMFVLVIIIGITAYEMLGVGKKEERYTVSVIVDDSNNGRWIAMREGIEQAARDNNIDVSYVFSGKFNNAGEEIELIQREIMNGTDGIIVQMVSNYEEINRLSEIFSQTTVMLLETDVEPQGLYAVTGPDNAAVGRAIGKAVAQDNNSLAEKGIGILCGNQEQIAMQERLMGLKEILEKEEARILWTLQGNNEPVGEALTENEEKMHVDLVIALGNEETELAVDYLLARAEEGKEGCLLYGVGYSEKAVYYLDKGWIQSLVIPNEFNMGYLSMEQIARQLKFHLSGAESSEIDYLVIDRTNLYEEKNQKILFPIVQ